MMDPTFVLAPTLSYLFSLLDSKIHSNNGTQIDCISLLSHVSSTGTADPSIPVSFVSSFNGHRSFFPIFGVSDLQTLNPTAIRTTQFGWDGN